MAIFDALIQSGFRVIPKIIISNWCKSFHDIIIILVSTSLLNLKNLGKKEGITKNSKFKGPKEVLGEIKSIFHNLSIKWFLKKTYTSFKKLNVSCILPWRLMT